MIAKPTPITTNPPERVGRRPRSCTQRPVHPQERFLGLVMLLNLSGLWAVAADLSDLLGAGVLLMVARVGPVLPVYATATALLLLAFALWWWTERRLA